MAVVLETNSSQGVVPVEMPVRPPEPATPPAEPAVSDQPPGETPPESAPVPAEPAESQEPSGEPDEPRGEGGFQRRIKTLVQQRNSLRDENATLRAQLAMQQQARQATQPSTQVSSPQPQSAPSALVPPRQEDFADVQAFSQAIEKYWRAMAAEEARGIVTATLQEREAQQAQQARQGVLQTWQERMEEGQALYEDFDAALRLLPRYVPEDLYPVIENVTVQEGQGARLLYYLSTHIPAMQELARYRPGPGADAYLRSLLGKVGGQTPPPAPVPAAPVTNGLAAATQVGIPPPVRPLAGGGPSSLGGERPQDVVARGGSIAEYEAAKTRMKEQGQRY